MTSYRNYLKNWTVIYPYCVALGLLTGVTPTAAIASEIVTTPTTETRPSRSQPPSLLQPDLLDAEETQDVEQVTSISQFTDVRPTDWAYQALQSLVERYGCIVGYPDKTYRGNRALTRYEFAAGLNACLDKIQELIAAATADFVKKEDLEVVKRLQEDFAAELAALRGRIEGLEVRTATLETQQFSTTTKLFGQVIFGMQGRSSDRSDFVSTRIPGLEGLPFLGRDGIRETADGADQITFGYNAQLSLVTQFSPRSLLLTGLQAGNITTTDRTLFGFNNGFTRLGYELNTGNDLRLSDLTFRYLIADNFAVIVGTEGINPVSVFRGPSRVEGEGFGPLSRFAQRNPILSLGATESGVGFDWQIAQRFSLQGVYAARFANNPTQGTGLFNGTYTAGAQLLVTPVNALDIALYYLNSYSGRLGGFLGTGIGDDQVSAVTDSRLSTNAYGATINWQVARTVALGGWVGFTDSQLVSDSGNVKTFNWMASLQFPDLFGKANLGAIFFGQPPRITDSNLRENGVLTGNVPSFFNSTLGEQAGGRSGTTYHLEAFYRWRVTDNVAITPGFIMLFNSAHNDNNGTIAIGAIRTTFSF